MTVYQNTLYYKLSGRRLMIISVGREKRWNYAAPKFLKYRTKDIRAMSFGICDHDSLLLQCLIAYQNTLYSKLNGRILLKGCMNVKEGWTRISRKFHNDWTSETWVVKYVPRNWKWWPSCACALFTRIGNGEQDCCCQELLLSWNKFQRSTKLHSL